MKIFFVVLLSVLTFTKLNAQKMLNKEYFVSPSISIGYTFGAKINYGFVLDLGLYDSERKDLKYGLSFSYYIVSVKDMKHKQRSLNLMVQNNYIDLKLGYGRMKNGWGYSNRNKCLVQGFSADICLSSNSIYAPEIGYKTFRYKQKNWAWFEGQYNSLYLGYDFIKLKK